MQGLSHYMQDFARGGIFSSCMGSFRFRFALSSLVRSFTCRHSSSSFPIAPLHSAFCRTLSLWCYRYGGQCCPLYPLLSAKHRSSFHQKKSWHPAWRFRFFYVYLPQANRQRKTHTSTFNHFMAQKCCV